ncbi:DNA topoisomerase IB [Piscinibacter terrae]|uniref:DNA topoisomerase n=1 Tax=Piscinibacter terrae TaxID=2496871 RepID=A0A3N7JV80_9BURK|nr:DNA topoisomerase IB [Albitalea terrae]RQP22815.1 DNA topoisomerase IB [Albitalea terrae]
MASSEAAQAPPGLVYVNDEAPGISRSRRGDAFVYRTPDGRLLRDKVQLDRIRRLAIPPAYTDVWICTRPNGHLQATGRDARGRKQYRYHPEWRMARDADKFARMLDFGRALPKLRRRVQRDLQRHVGEQPSRESVLAALVRLLDTTLVRIGNDEYARTNGSYGLTTLRNRHANVKGNSLRLRFRGKHGKVHDVSVDDPRVARIVRRCQAMPGQELFEYVDEAGQARCVGSADVNEYLREAAGDGFSAKDFRTWHATALALSLIKPDAADGERRSDKEVLAEVAQRLGNTVAVCRKAYVHPRVLEWTGFGAADAPAIKPRAGLAKAEAELLDFLQRLD